MDTLQPFRHVLLMNTFVDPLLQDLRQLWVLIYYKCGFEVRLLAHGIESEHV